MNRHLPLRRHAFLPSPRPMRGETKGEGILAIDQNESQAEGSSPRPSPLWGGEGEGKRFPWIFQVHGW